MTNRKILYLVTEDWAFLSHRLSLARAAKENGYEVLVATRENEHGNQIESEGFKLIPLGLSRGGTNIVQELLSILEIIRVYRREKPDLVHHIAGKPTLYGTLSARFSFCPVVVNLVTGITRTFHKSKWKSCLIEKIVMLTYRLAYFAVSPVTVFQNSSDMQVFLDNHIVKNESVKIIKGSGVNTDQFYEIEEPEGTAVVVLASRMLWEKGVKEFVDAAKWLYKKKINCRMVLVGGTDPESPKSVPLKMLKDWESKGIVEWWEHQEDMHKVFSKSHIVCLPSYHEGAPKVLLEAASTGRAIVTTDIPGCSQIVRKDKGGVVVPVGDSLKLAEAIRFLVENPKTRRKMGREGRKIVIEEFSDEVVIEKNLTLYRKLLDNKK